MSKKELVDAYLEGRISRRVFIRRLAAAGVSLGAALSYSQILDPSRALATHRDFYYYAERPPKKRRRRRR